MICELTGYDLEKAQGWHAGSDDLRKMSQERGIINYFWKAKPIE